MKYPHIFVLFYLLLLAIQVNSCKNASSPDDSIIYYNSFEQPSDLKGWNGIDSSNLANEAPPNGGLKSAFISGGCLIPTSSYTLGPTGEDLIIRIQWYGKNLGLGGNVTVYAGKNYNTDHTLSIKDTSWTFYQFEDSIYWPADSSFTICLNSGGIVPTAMLIDELKVVELE